MSKKTGAFRAKNICLRAVRDLSLYAVVLVIAFGAGSSLFAAPGDLTAEQARSATLSELRARPWTDMEAVLELARRGDPEVLRACLEQLSEAEADLVASGEHVLTGAAPALILQTIAGAFRPGAQPEPPINRPVLARVFLRVAQSRTTLPAAVRNWAAQQLIRTGEDQAAMLQALVKANWTAVGMLPWEQWQLPADQ